MADTEEWDVDVMVGVMEDIASRKIAMIQNYLERLRKFKRHLKEEEDQSRKLANFNPLK